MNRHAASAIAVGATTALAIGLSVAPPALAAGTGDAADPSFVRIGSDAAPAAPARAASAGRSAASPQPAARAAAKKAKSEQVLQVLKSIQGVGVDGMSVAVGAKHVVQVSEQLARTFVKATGAGQNKTVNQLFKTPSSTATLSQPAVAYDPIGKRWIVAAISDQAGDIGVIVRVSKGSAPTKWFPSHVYGNAATDAPVDVGMTDVVESVPQIGISSNKVAITTVADDPDDASVANRIMFFPSTGPQGLYADGESDAWTALVNSTYDGQMPAVNSTKQANLFIAVPDSDAIPSVDDVTVTTYTGKATTDPPVFSKNVMYPDDALVAPPAVPQTGGDTLDLGPVAFTGVAWRKGKLWATAATNCAGDACVRVFGVTTSAGVALIADETVSSPGLDWFSPSVAIDGSGKVHLVAADIGSAVGPSLAVFVRKGTDNWTDARLVRRGRFAVDPNNSPGTLEWGGSSSAAWDPTSPWDVWVAGVTGASGVPNDLTSRVARVSLAKNVASVKASKTRVAKGGKVTFTAKLKRPDSKNTFKGLPVALQRKPVNGGSWKTIKSGKTTQKGIAKWTVKVSKPGRYRTLGKSVAQTGSPPEGRMVAKVTSKALTVTLI
ncbi:MAG TPA: hypothetical protein VMW94_05495 [Actinomycetes bacterium]|nr:hypothetical protein [Actinomycetes bacterium]